MNALARARELEVVEVQAWRDFFAGAPPLPASALGLAPREVAGAIALVATSLDSYFFNRIVGLGVERPVSDTALDALTRHYAEHGVGFEVNLCPHAEPADLPHRLESRGLSAPFHHVKWIRGVESYTPRHTTLRLTRVKPREAMAFGRIASEIWGGGLLPSRDWFAASVGRRGWTHYVTWEGDEPAGIAALYVQGEGAWLGFDATRDMHRGKGSQATLVAARIRDAAALGCHWVSAETGPDWPDVDRTALRNMQRAGFAVAYERPCWIKV